MQTGVPEFNKQLQIGDFTVVAGCIPLKNQPGKITGAAAIMCDITGIRNLEQQVAELRETRSLLEAILHATDDAITVVNEEGNGILINPAYTKIRSHGRGCFAQACFRCAQKEKACI